MLQLQSFKQFAGFAEGEQAGEHFFSQNMIRTRNGISNFILINKISDKTSLPTLTSPIKWFSQGKTGPSGAGCLWGMDNNGNLYYSDSGTFAYVLEYCSAEYINNWNGMLIDQKNRLLYAGWRYIGLCDMTANYSTGTVQVTNGSAAVVGTGTTFTSGMVGKRFRIEGDNTFYKVLSYTDATHITLTSNYTGSSGSGKNYKVYTAWTDRKWDLGADYTDAGTEYRVMETFEDWVFIAVGNKIVGINTTDDSINQNVFDLPSGFIIKSIKANKSGILIGAVNASQSVLVLWNGIDDRASAPWTWLDEIITDRGIVNYNDGWIVMTQKTVYSSTGYGISPIKTKPLDVSFDGNYIFGGGPFVVDDILYFPGVNSITRARHFNGIYMLNLKTGMFSFAAYSHNRLYGVHGGAIGLFRDGNVSAINISYDSGNIGTANNIIARLLETPNPKAIFITGQLGGSSENEKTALAAKLFLSLLEKSADRQPYTFDLTLKIYNYKTRLATYAQQKALATQANQLTIDATTYTNMNVSEGDEVTILEGSNAGEIRHITGISGKGTSAEVWTLNSALPNMTEQYATLLAMPFKKVKTYNYSNISEIKDAYFDIKNRPQGKRFLLKFVIENATVPIEIQGGQFIYDDKGSLQ